MLKRAKKKASAPKKRKVATKTAAAKRKSTVAEKKKAASFNEKAQWKAFRELKAKLNKKMKKLKADYKKGAKPEVLIEDINMLGLIGGEANYMLLQLEKAEKSAKAAKKAPAKKKAAPKKKAAKKVAKKKVVKKAAPKKVVKRKAAKKRKPSVRRIAPMLFPIE